jgi:hypothetical protein
VSADPVVTQSRRGYGSAPATALISGVFAAFAYVLSLLVGEDLQQAIFIVLATASILICIGWVAPTARDTAGRIDVFHPSILVIAFYLVYFVGSAAVLVLFKDYQGEFVALQPDAGQTVNATMAVGILSIISFGVGARLHPIGVATRALRDRQLYGVVPVFCLAAIFLAVGMLARLYQLSLFGPLGVDILQYLSPGRRRELEIIVPQYLVTIGSMADWGGLLLLLTAVARTGRDTHFGRNTFFAGTLLIAIAVLSFAVSGKRSAVVLLVLPPIIWVHYLRRRVSVPKMVLLFGGGIAFIAVLLIGRITIPLIVSGADPSDFLGGTLAEVSTFYLQSAELSTFDMIAATMRYREELLASMGDNAVVSFVKMTFETLSVFIPGAVWPDKPAYTDTGHYYYRYFTGSDADVGLAVTSWGTAYLFFGVIGVVVGFVLLGWFSVSAFAAFSPRRRAPATAFLYAQFYLILFQFLRFGTIGFTFLYFVQSVMMGLIGILIISHPPAHRGANAAAGNSAYGK